MVKDTLSNMASEVGIRSIDYGEELVGKELGLLLREREREKERGLDIFRSPSAPPTVDGSLSSVGGLFAGGGESPFAGGKREITDEELRSDPAYINYYYSNVNLNPRLPPPLLSKEDWRFAQRLSGGGGGGSAGGAALGGIGDRRKVKGGDEFNNSNGSNNGSSSLFSKQPAFNGHKEQNNGQSEWSGVGLPGLGLGSRQKSIAEIIQVIFWS